MHGVGFCLAGSVKGEHSGNMARWRGDWLVDAAHDNSRVCGRAVSGGICWIAAAWRDYSGHADGMACEADWQMPGGER